MDILKKALLLRKTTFQHEEEAFIAFNDRIELPSKIIQKIELSDLPVEAKYEARRQYVVSLTAAFEIFWRRIIRDIIDADKNSALNYKKFTAIKFNLRDIQHIKQHKLSLGELVSSAYIFRNTEIVHDVLSDILEIDAFSEFRKFKCMITIEDLDSPRTISKQVFDGNEILKSTKDLIDKNIDIRNDTVHNTGASYKLTPQDIQRFSTALYFFNLSFSMFAQSKAGDVLKAQSNAVGQKKKSFEITLHSFGEHSQK